MEKEIAWVLCLHMDAHDKVKNIGRSEASIALNQPL